MTTPSKTWFIIGCLGLTVFIFVTTSQLPMGLLPEMAADLNKSQSMIGLLVSGYAWLAALLTLPLTVLCARFERRGLLLCLLVIFIMGHAWSGLAHGYLGLLLSRLLVAISHAVLWGLTTPMAVRLAPPGSGPKALAIMATGVALSAILGVPLSTLLGHELGWRMAFWAIGAVGLVMLALLFFMLPKMPSTNPEPLKNLAVLLKNKSLNKLYLLVLLATVAHAAGFTYFTPFMRDFGNFSPQTTVHLLLLFGLSGVAGSFFASHYAKKRLAIAMGIALVCLVANFALAHFSVRGGLPGAIAYCAMWGVMMSGLGVLFQTKVFVEADKATDLGMAMYAVYFNVAIGLGAAIGGLSLDNLGIASINYTAMGCTVLALLSFAWLQKSPAKLTKGNRHG